MAESIVALGFGMTGLVALIAGILAWFLMTWINKGGMLIKY